MKKFFFLVLSIGILNFCFSQEPAGNRKSFPAELGKIAKIKENSNILEIKDEFRIPAEDFFNRYQAYFALQEHDSMVPFDTVENKKGTRHYRYNQYYKNVPVQGAVMILHERDNLVYKANGNFVTNISLDCQPGISAETAIETAVKRSDAKVFAWQVPDMENDLKTIKKNENATYYPNPKLIIYDKTYSADPARYRLTYEIEIFSVEPLSREIFYVDAKTGVVLHSVKKNTSVNVEVQAETRYNGVKTITVDSLSPTQFVLRSNNRGAGDGILTKSLNNNGSYYDVPTASATLITESDNYFNEDKAANSAHFGAEKTYDYYYTKFGRNSYDDSGTQLLSYVHWGNSIGNAMWIGTAMVYGDGTNNSYPFTLIEVCGHEISHGVTEYSAGLIYEYESGALNEAFSDIFGAMIYYYATGNYKWLIGEEIGAFRSMSNPNQFQNPDTYKGTYWQYSAADNGGVHTNSGVANYWFYLLTMGGSGVNDLGNSFSVPALGSEKSEAIAYTVLTSYLTPSSNYQDTYLASLEAAELLYGECSDEYIAVTKAWYAVGIGERFTDNAVYLNNVISPVTSCVMADDETIQLDLFYNSCDGSTLPIGSKIHFMIVFDQNTTIFDTVSLVNTISSGDHFTLTLNKTLDLSTFGDHRLDIYVKGEIMPVYSDSLINFTITNRTYQNDDIGISEIVSPAASSCQLSDDTPITVKIFFNGCDFKAAGDVIKVAYTLNGSDPVEEEFVLDNNFTPQDSITYTFVKKADFMATPKNTLVAYTRNSDDSNNGNDQVEKAFTRPISLNDIPQVTFNESPSTDYYYKETGEYASITTAMQGGYPNGKVLIMTGGNLFEYATEITFPEPENHWEANAKLSAKATFCVDAREMESVSLHFDLKQTSGKNLYEYYIGLFPYGTDLSYSSALRVLVNGEHVGNTTYVPNTGTGDPYVTKTVNLSSYTGNLLDITFESKCIGADMQGYTLDNVFLDNISITAVPSGIGNITAGDLKGILYPNPGAGSYTIAIEASEPANAAIEVFDLTGRRVFAQDHTLMQGEQYIPLNLNQLDAGIYMVSLSSAIGKATYKVVKQ